MPLKLKRQPEPPEPQRQPGGFVHLKAWSGPSAVAAATKIIARSGGRGQELAFCNNSIESDGYDIFTRTSLRLHAHSGAVLLVWLCT